jgi:hypothetical protein
MVADHLSLALEIVWVFEAGDHIADFLLASHSWYPSSGVGVDTTLRRRE